MKPLKRRLGDIAYTSSGSISTLQLPRNFNYRALICRLAGSVIVTGGTGAGAPHVYGAYKAISKIEVIANGRDTIISIAPDHLQILNTIDYGTVPVFLNPTNDTAATYPFNCSFVVPFEVHRSVRPIDTLLPSAGLSTLDLKVTWGAGSDMFTGAVDFTSAVIQTSTTLSVQSFEEIGSLPGAVSVSKMYTISRTLAASANTNFQVQISVGNLYRGFLVQTNVANVMNDTIIDGFSLESGTEVFQKWLTNDEVLDYNKLLYSLETRLIGNHYLDFLDSDGFMSEILDTRGLSGLDLILNMAAVAGNLIVVPNEIIIPVKAA